jgi:small subunit ribosomal protein S4
MGDPRKLRSKYAAPRKVWNAERIRKEGKLASAYGLKNTREIWRTLNALKKARSGAMKYLSQGEAGVQKAQPLMQRLARMGIIGAEAKLDDILSLSVENFLDRRLQTRVMKKGLARTARQARQLITHGFIAVKGRKVTVPSYMVTAEEEQYIAYYKPIDITVHEAEPQSKRAAPREVPAQRAEAPPPSDAGHVEGQSPEAGGEAAEAPKAE